MKYERPKCFSECRYCNSKELDLMWHEFKTSVTHIAIVCNNCKRLIGHAPVIQENIEQTSGVWTKELRLKKKRAPKKTMLLYK